MPCMCKRLAPTLLSYARGLARAIVKASVTVTALVLAYGGVTDFVGHGYASVADILILGSAPKYLAVVVSGWCGILMLLSAVALRSARLAPTLVVVGVGLLYLSLLCMIWVSAFPLFTLGTSIPFLALSGWVLARRGCVGGFGGALPVTARKA